MTDKYWLDKYFYFSPLYSGTKTKRHNFFNHRVAYPSSNLTSYIYWARYKNYWYQTDDEQTERNRTNLLREI
ncbi:hypothetical protein niasHS_002259 [Heterodera schachtii]|uniref:Uncharacterized protein n=1 Tax=Heterodera schachtii TaxID=97005 RepID=A0ABD2KND1_HETSC